jgi:tripartite-type tricarboxylate transporter receptor subunit TctC
MRNNQTTKNLVLLMALLLSQCFSSHAQNTSYPNKPITLVVPFPPGGVADIVARPVAEALGRELGQAVLVENRAGAGGGIGMGYVAKAKADGYTLLLALSSLTVIPEADSVIGRAPMFAPNDLRPIARFTADPTVLAVRADASWRNLKEFLEDARKRPKAINYGSSGNYGTMHIPVVMLEQGANVSLTHVPFTGAGPAVVALLSGQIDAVASGPATVLQNIKAGKLRALTQWGSSRLDVLPNVPYLLEDGINVQYAQWSGLFAPSGVPEPVVQKIRQAARVVANDPRVRESILSAGSPVQFMDSPEFERYVQQDFKKMSELVRRIGKLE